MKYDPLTGKVERTAEDRARYEAIRSQHAENPSREELQANGTYTPVGTMESYVALRRVQRTLRELREQSGMTVPELAVRAGLTPAVAEQIETGPVAELSIALINRYAASLGKHIELEIADLQTQA